MNDKMYQLASRHGALLTRIAMQRTVLRDHAQGVRSLLDKGDAVFRGIGWIKANPLAVGAAVAVAVLLKPRRILPWGRRVFLLWRGWLAIRKKLSGAG